MKSMKSWSRRGLICLVAALFVPVVGGGQAYADDAAPDVASSAEAVVDVGALAGSPIAEPLELAGDMAVQTGDTTVVLSADPVDGAELQLADGTVIGLDIPGAAKADDAVRVTDGAVVYEHIAADTSLITQSTESGGLQALIAIDGPQAPKEFAFPVTVPDGGFLDDVGDGSIDVVDANGVTVAFVAPAWATDADGNAVPTRLEIRGTTLIQHVDHQGATYPVVADPTFQGDCGWVTCTVRLSRGATRNARDASWIIGAAAGACGVLSGGTLAVVCGAAIAPASVVLAVAAGRYYEDGNCLGIRFTKTPPATAAWPVSVKRGSYNCA